MISACTTHGTEDPQSSQESEKPMTVAKRVMLGKYDLERMTTGERAEAGEILVFGRLTGGSPSQADIGKGMCPLCHRVTGLIEKNTAPDLTAKDASGVPIALRGEIRVGEPRYKQGQFAQMESYPGSGRATNNVEYLAESHVCPSCYVVAGFGKKGTNDRESPMVAMHAPPNCQTIEESVMIDTYLFVKDGLNPPPASEILAAYKKFLPVSGNVFPGCG